MLVQHAQQIHRHQHHHQHLIYRQVPEVKAVQITIQVHQALASRHHQVAVAIMVEEEVAAVEEVLVHLNQAQ
jgi:hypothetical protein